jgi:hypothetical protein
MAIYYSVFFTLVLFSFWEIYNPSWSKIIGLFVAVFFINFVGIRYAVGNDYFTYYENYQGINNGSGTVSTEIAYVFLNKILSFETVIYIFSLLSFIFLNSAIDFFCLRHKILSYLVYFSFFLITFNLHIIRQGLAIAIILYGYRFLFNKNYLKFILIVLIASTFHLSALILLPFTLLINLKIAPFYQFLLIFTSLGILLFQEVIVGFYYSIAGNIPFLNKYLLVYREEERISYGLSSGMILDLIVLLTLFFKRNLLLEKEEFLFRIFFISTLLTFVLSIDPAALRLVYYFRIVIIFLIPLFFRLFKFQFLSFIIISAICLQYLWITFNVEGEYGRGDRNLAYFTIFNKGDFQHLP